MDLTNTMIMWDRETGDVQLVSWPKRTTEFEHYSDTGASYEHVRNMSLKDRAIFLGGVFIDLTTRESINPKTLLKAVSNLRECNVLFS